MLQRAVATGNVAADMPACRRRCEIILLERGIFDARSAHRCQSKRLFRKYGA
jgi:hypothetical protein